MQSTVNQISIPGFSPEQISALSKLISDAVDQAFNRHFGPLQQLLQQPTPSPLTQPTSPAKKKRNQKTRQQHKRKQAQAQSQCVTMMQVQEVDHIQEVEHLEASKHVVLHRQTSWDWMATSPQHAVISCLEMASFVQNGAICMPRMGVG